MKKILTIPNFIILLLLIIVIVEFFNPYNILPNRVSYEIKTDSIPYAVHDTVEVEVEVPYEVEVEVEKLVEVPVNQLVDTLGILKIYYAKNTFPNTLTLPNGVGTISLVDTISQNKVIGRSFTTNIKQKIVKEIIIEKEEPKTKYYGGFNFGMNSADFVSHISTGVMIKTKKEKIYSLNIGVTNRTIDGTSGTFTPYIGMGTYWKIGKK
jgi:hypothetical protein